MSTWIVSIPTCPTHGNTGLHHFVIDAPSAQQAEQQAFSRADTDAARRSRRHADLDLCCPATVERYLGPCGTLGLLHRFGIGT
ncbi:hypothetical protein [Streptomyces sp. NRRL S-813]|uniref:hypothetical protein n=1 Tax=Streptomyces sp. NRRL S-813 TaxID=1463919 RepID=UPI0005613EFB|nr:hypothetical protein [Streptomyces sp. NRRL S-813]